MLGICVDNRLPYIVSEFVDGQSVKYYINNSTESLTWPQRVKIVMHFILSIQFCNLYKQLMKINWLFNIYTPLVMGKILYCIYTVRSATPDKKRRLFHV